MSYRCLFKSELCVSGSQTADVVEQRWWVARATSPNGRELVLPSETERCFEPTGGSRTVFGFSHRLETVAVVRRDSEETCHVSSSCPDTQ